MVCRVHRNFHFLAEPRQRDMAAPLTAAALLEASAGAARMHRMRAHRNLVCATQFLGKTAVTKCSTRTDLSRQTNPRHARGQPFPATPLRSPLSSLPDPGLELPDFCLLVVGAIPRRRQVRRQADDGSGDAHVSVLHHHQQGQAAVEAQPSPTDHVHLPPGPVPLDSRTGITRAPLCVRQIACWKVKRRSRTLHVEVEARLGQVGHC